jgi:hypothetical protein
MPVISERRVSRLAWLAAREGKPNWHKRRSGDSLLPGGSPFKRPPCCSNPISERPHDFACDRFGYSQGYTGHREAILSVVEKFRQDFPVRLTVESSLNWLFGAIV